MKVWIEGEIVDGANARIPVTDHGLLYGDGVFEGIRLYSGRVFRLDAHLERLRHSARAIGLDLPGGVTKIREIVLATARAYGQPDGYVRPLVTRGGRWAGPHDRANPRVVCIACEIGLYPDASRANMVIGQPDGARRADPRVKSLRTT
jgi:branched-chain amino acid aminotransferase